MAETYEESAIKTLKRLLAAEPQKPECVVWYGTDDDGPAEDGLVLRRKFSVIYLPAGLDAEDWLRAKVGESSIKPSPR